MPLGGKDSGRRAARALQPGAVGTGREAIFVSATRHRFFFHSLIKKGVSNYVQGNQTSEVSKTSEFFPDWREFMEMEQFFGETSKVQEDGDELYLIARDAHRLCHVFVERPKRVGSTLCGNPAIQGRTWF